MEKKSWKESYSELQRIVLPGDTNVFDSLYGGRLVEWIDNVASIVAMKHSRKRTVTGSIDNLFFLSPIRMGYIVYMKGRINFTSRTTMEIEVDVESEEGITGTRRFTTKAYLTYVAIDADGRPIDCPGLLLETDDDKRRFEEGRLESQIKLIPGVVEVGLFVNMASKIIVGNGDSAYEINPFKS